MVFDTVSSADSRDKAANYKKKFDHLALNYQSSHGSQAEEGVDSTIT